MARRPLVAGNWKMNGSLDFIDEIKDALNNESSLNVDAVVCPPACFLPSLAGQTFRIASQDVSVHANGAYTGELSAKMLSAVGCTYAIVGHSERREYHGESSDLVVDKALAAISEGLTPIVCVGEPLEVREADQQDAYVATQLAPLLDKLTEKQLAKCVIAYEPVWAIGTGKTASPEQAQLMHAFIRNKIAQSSAELAGEIRIVYGGSVKPDNAKELFAQRDIDGGLIGGASLDTKSFLTICKAV